MLLKCELMLLTSQINTNTDKKGFLLPIKCLEWVLKYSYLVSIILNYQFPKQCLRIFFVLILDFNSVVFPIPVINPPPTDIRLRVAPGTVNTLVTQRTHIGSYVSTWCQ